MTVLRTFYARVAFTDLDGHHEAGSEVRLAYGTDQEIADAQSMVAYGVVSTQAPEQAPVAQPEPEPTAPVVGPGPMVYATQQEQDTHVDQVPAGSLAEQPDLSPSVEEDSAEDPQPGGDQAEANALAKEAEGDAAKDDPETPHFDARNEEGVFVKEGTPVKAPAKKATRRRR